MTGGRAVRGLLLLALVATAACTRGRRSGEGERAPTGTDAPPSAGALPAGSAALEPGVTVDTQVVASDSVQEAPPADPDTAS